MYNKHDGYMNDIMLGKRFENYSAAMMDSKIYMRKCTKISIRIANKKLCCVKG